MKRVLALVLFGLVMLIAGFLLRSTSVTASPLFSEVSVTRSQSKGTFTLQDVAKFEWVDKRCRTWAADGDIDIDQTCLAVKTIRGGIVAIPNQFNEDWFKETSDPKTSKDKWIRRFYSLGGGVK